MKSGINQWAFPRHMPVQEALTLAAEAGFEAFEPCVGEDGPIPLDLPESEAKIIRKIADDLKIELASVATASGWDFPLTSADATQREAGIEQASQVLRIAKLLGTKVVALVPGFVDANLPYDEAIEHALRSLEALVPLAESLRVCIAVENAQNKFLLSPVEMRDFITHLESEYLGAYLDTGSAALNGYAPHWIRILGSQIKGVHAKDARADRAESDRFAPLLEGDVDWPETIAALRSVDYTGPLISDLNGGPATAEGALGQTVERLQGILSK